MTAPLPSGWRQLPGERVTLYCSVALRLVDDFTGGQPLGAIRSTLEVETTPGAFAPVSRPATLTPSGLLLYPGLERRLHPAGRPSRRYRVRVEAELYRPRYRAAADGELFDVLPWDDLTGPATLTTAPRDCFLYPGPGYAFPREVPVLHGLVVDGAGRPVEDVLVRQANVENTLTDGRGAFSLPLRWAATGAPIDATDVRRGRQASFNLVLPDDLRRCRTLTVV